jgi:hypothetical protein
MRKYKIEDITQFVSQTEREQLENDAKFEVEILCRISKASYGYVHKNQI